MTAVGRLTLRVQPGARHSGFTGWYGEIPKYAVAAPPVGGAANAAVTLALADALGVRPRAVRIVSGWTSRTKTVEVDGVDSEQILRRITSLIPR